MAERKVNKFLSSSVWYLIATVAGYSAAFIGNIVFTHIMSQEHYGLYTNYYSIVVLICPFVCANLFVGLQNGFFDFKDYRKELRSSLLFLSGIIFVLFSATFITITICIPSGFKQNLSLDIVIFALIHAYSFFVINYFNVYCNLSNKYKVRSILLFLQNLVQFLFPLAFIVFVGKNSYHERVLGSSLPLAIIAAILVSIIFYNGKQLINTRLWSYALKISVPSLLSSFSSLAMQNADHIMITEMKGAESTAVYGFMYNISNILVLLLSALGGAVSAWLYNALDSGRLSAARMGQKWFYLFFVAVISTVLMIFPEFITLIVDPSYRDFSYIPPFVAGSALGVINCLHGDIMTFHKKTGIISVCVAISAICNIVLNYVFIERAGAVAAAYTSFIALLLMTLLYRVAMKRIRKNIFSDMYSLLYFIVVLCLCGTFIFVEKKILERYLIYSVVIVALAFMSFMKRDEIKNLIKA